jgi:hypothetical protein
MEQCKMDENSKGEMKPGLLSMRPINPAPNLANTERAREPLRVDPPRRGCPNDLPATGLLRDGAPLDASPHQYGPRGEKMRAPMYGADRRK